MEVTYLRSKRFAHLANHLELRGNLTRGDGGRSWWVVFEDDYPPVLIGAEHELPGYAKRQLAKLRAAPQLNCRREARHIGADLIFTPDTSHGGIPHSENVDWLRQFKRAGDYDVTKGYLVVLAVPGNEDVVVEVWESQRSNRSLEINLLSSEYRLVWKETDSET